VSPSSLIFVAVVAVWAAYLVVDTSRRREYLATARTVERFSSSMRVLQRRAVRRESAEAFEASTAPMRSTSSVRLHRGAQPTRAAIEARAARAGAGIIARTGGGAAALAERERERAAAYRRRARLGAAVTLAVALTTLVAAVFAALGHLTWSAPAMGLATTGLLLVLLRRHALAGRRVVSSARPGDAPATRRRRSSAAPVAATVTPGAKTAVAETAVATGAPASEPVEVVVGEPAPFDYAREVEPSVVAEQAYAQRVAARAEDSDPLLADSGWAPVFVPPPTYTLKARAERPLPPPIEIEDVPVPVEVEWEDLDALAYGRASGQ